MNFVFIVWAPRQDSYATAPLGPGDSLGMVRLPEEEIMGMSVIGWMQDQPKY